VLFVVVKRHPVPDIPGKRLKGITYLWMAANLNSLLAKFIILSPSSVRRVCQVYLVRGASSRQEQTLDSSNTKLAL
jgi:hypothetical protein